MAVSLGELAVRFGCELRGDPDITVERVATLARRRGAARSSFLANPRYRAQLAATARRGRRAERRGRGRVSDRDAREREPLRRPTRASRRCCTRRRRSPPGVHPTRDRRRRARASIRARTWARSR